MPNANKDAALWPYLILVFIKAKKAGPKEKVSSKTITRVGYIKLRYNCFAFMLI